MYNKGELFEVGDWILHDGEILLLVALHIHTGGARPNTTCQSWGPCSVDSSVVGALKADFRLSNGVHHTGVGVVVPG